MGIVTATSEVFEEGMPDWVLASSVPELFGGEGAQHRPDGSATRPSVQPRLDPVNRQGQEKKPGRQSKKSLIFGALGLLLLVLIGIGVYWFIENRRWWKEFAAFQQLQEKKAAEKMREEGEGKAASGNDSTPLSNQFEERRFCSDPEYAARWIYSLFNDARKIEEQGNEFRTNEAVKEARSKLSKLKGTKVAWPFAVKRVREAGVVALDGFDSYNKKGNEGLFTLTINRTLDQVVQSDDWERWPPQRDHVGDSAWYFPGGQDQVAAGQLSRGDKVIIQGTIVEIRNTAVYGGRFLLTEIILGSEAKLRRN